MMNEEQRGEIDSFIFIYFHMNLKTFGVVTVFKNNPSPLFKQNVMMYFFI